MLDTPLSSPACEVAVHVRPSARHDQHSALPEPRPRPGGAAPVTRGVAAAVLAVATLITAANVCPARAATHAPASIVQQQPGHP
ncbi:hypothetical protein [Streptomyces sp. NPDC057413]|uniref:hypothetical protein n=1 Tax=unclassified Streptomyces TaxID=2593676 RepID=UPI0036569B36